MNISSVAVGRGCVNDIAYLLAVLEGFKYAVDNNAVGGFVILYYLFCVGDIFDFVTSAAFTLTASLVYMKNKTKANAIKACILGVIVFTVISLPLNYFIVYPIYFKAYGGEAAILGLYREILPRVKNTFSALCIFNLPFTFIKGVLCAAVTILIYKPLSPMLKGKG